MKKRLLLLSLVLILVLSVFIITLIKAETTPSPTPPGTPNPAVGGEIDPVTGLPTSTEKIQEIGDKIKDENYLKNEYQKILNKSDTLKPLFNFYNKISPVADPAFKYTVGVTPSISWLFLLALILWIAFVIYIFGFASLFKIASNGIYYTVVLIAILVVSYFGIAAKLADFIVKYISKAGSWRIQLIIVIIIILALVLASIFSRSILKLEKGIKEKKDKEEEKNNREKLKRDIELADTFRKELTKK